MIIIAKEYIERQRAKEHLIGDYAYAAAKMLDDIPAADVVEVIRCKDCIYAFMTIGKEKVKYCDMFKSDEGVYFDKNHFCSYGIKKEGDSLCHG